MIGAHGLAGQVLVLSKLSLFPFLPSRTITHKIKAGNIQDRDIDVTAQVEWGHSIVCP